MLQWKQYRRDGVLFSVIPWVAFLAFAVALTEGQTTSSKTKSAKAPPGNSPTPIAAGAPASTPPALPASDPLGRNSPRGCVLGFLRAEENREFDQAVKYLDSDRPDAETKELAMQLKSLLDLGTSSDLDVLSRTSDGDLTENLHTSRERIAVVATPVGTLEVILNRVQRPNEQPIWLFSQETLRQVPKIYAGLADKHEQQRDYASHFPAWMSKVSFFSIPLWRWTVFVVALAVVLFMASVLTRLTLRLLNLVFRGRMSSTTEIAVMKLKGPIFGLMMAIIEYFWSSHSKTALGRNRWEVAATITLLIASAWLLIRLADIVASYSRHRFIAQLRTERVTFIGLFARMFKILVVVILLIILLTKAGVNVSALITGLGIGGVAIAFAAQKTLSDLFAGISIVMRGAVRVGDFCTIAGRQGTVEEIGISSLRMRTLDRTVVTIPNSKVAETELENFTMRDQFWLHQVFTLRFDTPYSVVQRILDGTLDILKAHPDLDTISARARLVQLTKEGPQVEVFAYHSSPGADWSIFLAEQERIFLEIMRLVQKEGTAISAPVGFVQLQGTETERLLMR